MAEWTPPTDAVASNDNTEWTPPTDATLEGEVAKKIYPYHNRHRMVLYQNQRKVNPLTVPNLFQKRFHLIL